MGKFKKWLNKPISGVLDPTNPPKGVSPKAKAPLKGKQPNKPGAIGVGKQGVSTHPFKVSDRVSVTKSGNIVGAGNIVEIGRQAKGKQLDIMVELDGGMEMPVKPEWLKKLPKDAKLPTINPNKRSSIASSKRMPACLKCNNGLRYEPGSTFLYTDGFAHAFQLDGLRNYSHIILVPKTMFLGKIPMDERILCETCDRCRFGSVTPVNPSVKTATMDHKLLASKGIVAVIFVPNPKR